MIVPPAEARPFDAVLCDLDNVIRSYDMSRVAALERSAGPAEGTTAGVAYAPEVDLPLLLGRIGTAEWEASIVRGLEGRVPEPRARELAAAFAHAPFHADEAVVALLRRIRELMPLVLVTNATLRLDSDLAALGLADLAHHVVGSAHVGVAKPDPAIYAIAVERAAVPARRCLFVDDRAENVEAARALGMTGTLFREPADLRRALAPALGE